MGEMERHLCSLSSHKRACYWFHHWIYMLDSSMVKEEEVEMTKALSVLSRPKAVSEHGRKDGDHWQELSKDYQNSIHTVFKCGGTRLRSDRNDRILKVAKSLSLAPKVCQHRHYSGSEIEVRKKICASNMLSTSITIEIFELTK